MTCETYYEIPMSPSHYQNDSPRVRSQFARNHYVTGQRDQKRTKNATLEYLKKNKIDCLLFIVIIITIILLCIQIGFIIDHYYDDRELYAKIQNYLNNSESQRVEVRYIHNHDRSSTLSSPLPVFNSTVKATID